MCTLGRMCVRVSVAKPNNYLISSERIFVSSIISKMFVCACVDEELEKTIFCSH